MDNRMFRDAMGKFATGITVVTTELDGEVSGMTVNAFMSVSLEPKLVVVSIDKKAETLKLLQKAKKYAVSILNNDQAEYSKIFAGQIKNKDDVTFNKLNGLPVLKDALVTLTCRVVNEYEAGDHVLFIGEVTDLVINDGEPLLYYGGTYRELRA
mgnify:CR=1 FL=1